MPSSCFPMKKNISMQDLILEESPGSINDPKRVLIVMDALKEFSIELLEWVLKNFTFNNCCTITLLGIMPWLNIPLSSKTWSDIWTMNLEDLSSFQEKNDQFKSDPKYQKIQRLTELCQQYGVVPEIISEMGHPLRLLVVEQICSLHATLVVFDRHHDKKYIEFYAEKIPCNMVVMNDNGEADLIKKRKFNNSTEEVADQTPQMDSPIPSSIAYCSTSIISQHLRKCLKSKNRLKHDKN